MTKLFVYYDEEGDYLEINIGGYSYGSFEEIEEGILECIHEKDKIIGIMIIGFNNKIRNLKEIKLPFFMKSHLTIYYDEESDFLEIFIGKPTKSIATEIEPGIFIRKDEKTNELKSIEILGFKKRTKNLEDIEINLPIEVVS